jgi:hypothetical protein
LPTLHVPYTWIDEWTDEQTYRRKTARDIKTVLY